MKSYSAFYVRGDDIQAAREVFRAGEPLAGSAWILGRYEKDDEPPDDDVLQGRATLAVEASKRAGEVVFVYGDTSTDSFVYEHARDGALLRKLVFFAMLDDDWTPGWLCVEGQPEAWEAALFRPDTLSRLIESERQTFQDEGRSDFAAREAELREAWSAQRIASGRSYPPCDGTVALLVEKSLGIQRL